MNATIDSTFPSNLPPNNSLNTSLNTSLTTSLNSRANVSPDEEAALRHVRKIRGFYGHLTQYVIVISGLVILNLFTSPRYFWAIWPAMGWGLGVLFHGMRVFGKMPFMNADWEKRQVEKYLGRKL